MKTFTEAEIESLIARFENQKLPKSEWTHEAHLIVGIWYCSKHEFDEALVLVRKLIIRHNESVGTVNSDMEGYHETITRFWLLNAEAFLGSRKGESITKNCNDFILSDVGRSSYPLTFYNIELLFSVHARQFWVDPDRLPITALFKRSKD